MVSLSLLTAPLPSGRFSDAALLARPPANYVKTLQTLDISDPATAPPAEPAFGTSGNLSEEQELFCWGGPGAGAGSKGGNIAAQASTQRRDS